MKVRLNEVDFSMIENDDFGKRWEGEYSDLDFKTPEEMLAYIQNGCGNIWSPDLEQYVFSYNDYGSIAYYDVDEDEAIELETEARESGDYWGAFLGSGGRICDTIKYQIEEQGASPDDEDLYDEALAYCEDHYNATWINCSDVI